MLGGLISFAAASRQFLNYKKKMYTKRPNQAPNAWLVVKPDKSFLADFIFPVCAFPKPYSDC
jgi:hypothetical protein